MSLRRFVSPLLVLAMGAGGNSGVLSEASNDEIIVLGRDEWETPPQVGNNGHTPKPGAGVSGGDSAFPSTAAPECYDILFKEGKYSWWASSCDLSVNEGTEGSPWWERPEPGEPGEAGDAGPLPPGEPVIVTAQELQSLVVDSGGLTVQPGRPWVLVNMDTIVMTGASEQMLSTVVLGVPVRVRVVPAEFSWDFGDGSAPLVGTDPGAAWPNHTVSHVYTDPGMVQISLTTQWDGYFQPEGTSTWVPVTGRAVTTETSEPIEVITAVPRLVTGN